MTALAHLTEITDGGFTVFVPFEDTYLLERRQITNFEVRIDDGRTISAEQRAKAHVLIADIAQHTGHTPEEIKEIMKYYFMADTGADYFSLSDVDMTTARAFIDHMIEFCIAWNVPCKESLWHHAPDIGKYLYWCLWYRKCCVCGGQAEIHHTEAIGMGANRYEMCHIGYPAMALCGKHHREAHDIGQLAFNDRWHVYGVTLDEELVRHLKLGRFGDEDHSSEGIQPDQGGDAFPRDAAV